jgi:hypothetical protein
MFRTTTAIAVFVIIAAICVPAPVARAGDDGPTIPPPPAPAVDQAPSKPAQSPAPKTKPKPSKAAAARSPNGTRAPNSTRGSVIAPVEGPDETRDDSPPGPAARREIPGLQQFRQPDGTFALPGGVGIIDPKEDHVGVQINTPAGVFQINVPRRQREAGPDGPPSADGPGPLGPDGPDLTAVRASREFAIASRTFSARNYSAALRRLNRYLERDGGDHELLQLRSLTNFMLNDYKAAYRDALAVTAIGGVWDWPTLSSLYPSVDEYSAQFHALGKHVSANPSASQATFLLAYHNLMLGHSDVARREFARVAEIDPSNETARRLAAGQRTPQSGPTPANSDAGSPPSGGAPVPQGPPQAKPSGGPAVDLGQPAPLATQKTQPGGDK